MNLAATQDKIIKIRRADERGHANHGWLDSYHTFSFANYYDPAHMGFRALRVINEDQIHGGRGFGMHGHRDMEILTYVLDGALEHKDSMGNTAIMRPGEVQRMSAGTGVMHSEFNPSDTDPVHLLQIWILPGQTGLPPSYEQKFFPPEGKQNQLRLIASSDGRDGSVTIHQDMNLYAVLLEVGASVTYAADPKRHTWLQVARGQIQLDDRLLTAGDAAAISQAEAFTLTGVEAAEILLFDLA